MKRISDPLKLYISSSIISTSFNKLPDVLWDSNWYYFRFLSVLGWIYWWLLQTPQALVKIVIDQQEFLSEHTKTLKHQSSEFLVVSNLRHCFFFECLQEISVAVALIRDSLELDLDSNWIKHIFWFIWEFGQNNPGITSCLKYPSFWPYFSIWESQKPASFLECLFIL